MYRDAQGKTLTDYPRPSVAVDTAVLTVVGDALGVVLVDDARDASLKRLPGTFLHEGELLADAVRRSLASKCGVFGLAPTQLHVFDALERDDRGRVLSVAHLVAVPANAIDGASVTPVAHVGRLAYDHEKILSRAVARLRADYASRPDPWRLLGDQPFGLLELERLHRSVDPERPESKDTFRRLMEPQLTSTGTLRSGTVGKPARLFTHRHAQS